MKKLKIEIKGGPATGKSSVARAIQFWLSRYEIKADIKGCEDEVSETLEKDWPERLIGFESSLYVEIETIREASSR
jgi:hypothetical protein